VLICTGWRVASAVILSWGLTFLVSPAARAQLVPKHQVTAADVEALKDALYMRLSPDGTKLAYVLGERQGEIWIISTRRGSAPSKLAEGTVPTWSPDSKRLAYYSSQSGALQLWVVDLHSRRAAQVTTMTGGIDADPFTRFSGFHYAPLLLSWSPDGARLVFSSQLPATPYKPGHAPVGSVSNQDFGGNAPLVLTNTTPPDWTLEGVFRSDFRAAQPTGNVSQSSKPGRELSFAPTKVSQLFVVDVQTKVISQLTTDNAIYFNPDWSPDGAQIVCASSEGQSLFWPRSGRQQYLHD